MMKQNWIFLVFILPLACANETSRIVGGSVVSPHIIPYQVGLTTSQGSPPFCGGSLISPNYVLTAAHCTVGQSASNIKVFVGEHNWQVSGDGESYFNVASILVHPNYDPANLWSNDFSILRLSTSVPLSSSFVDLVCLPPDVTQTFDGQLLLTSGWGRTSFNGPLSPALKSSYLKAVSNTKCQNYYGSQIGSAHICAVAEDFNSSTCNGDSGGPLTAVVNAKWTLVGVTSFGASCNTGYPAAYARVSSQKSWILANTDVANFACGTKTTHDCGNYPRIDLNRIKPIVVQGREVETACTWDGWTVIQSRGQFSWFPNDYFSRKNWEDYKRGFGTPGEEFWLGLDNIFGLTQSKAYTLRITIETFEGLKMSRFYTNFKLLDKTFYTLSINATYGDGDDALAYHKGGKFSTFDRDNDGSTDNCAEKFKGAWWYVNCYQSDLNGFNFGPGETPFGIGISWFRYKSLAKAEMAIKAI